MNGRPEIHRGVRHSASASGDTVRTAVGLAAAVQRLIFDYERRNGGPVKRARLAKMVGVSASSMYAYLNGTTVPPANTFDRLMEVLDVPGSERRRLATARDDLVIAGAVCERRLDAIADAPTVAPRQLPMDIAEFTGRTGELHRLDALADLATGQGTATIVSVIEGMAGVGKTRLAVRAAHQIVATGRFDEIQLWVDLHGFDPKQAPADPSEVLAMFLRLLGVPGEQVPHEVEARAALYRDRLDDQRALVLLDNAASEEQVRPLLPGSPTCLVLVTSRRGLPGLDGAHAVRLDVLAVEEAVDLLARVAGHDRIIAESETAAQIAEQCGYLPIAVTLAARLLQTRPAWTLAHLAKRLTTADRRLAKLTVGDRDVRVAFSLSYCHLHPDLQRTFRLLGLHSGEDFTPPSTATLVNVTPEEAERRLDELLDNHLLQQATPGRYRFHDLMRTYAREQAHEHESVTQRRAAIRRLLCWYLCVADAAQRSVSPATEPVALIGSDGPGPLAFRTSEEALEWFQSEHNNLLAASHTAVDYSLHGLAWRIPAALKVYLEYARSLSDWVVLGEIAVTSARLARDRYGETRALNVVGNAYWEQLRLEESRETQELALAINRELGRPAAMGTCLNNIGACYQQKGEFTRAISYYNQALLVAPECESGETSAMLSQHQSITLMSLGESHYGLGRFLESVRYFTRSLAIFRAIGNRYHESFALTYLAHARAALGQWQEARSRYEEALAIHDSMKNRYGQAETFIGLATICDHHGQADRAREYRSRAITILDRLNAPTMDKLRTRIAHAAPLPACPDGAAD